MVCEWEWVVEGATQGDVSVLQDLTKGGAGWGAPGGLPTLLRVLHSSQMYPWQKTPAVDHLCLGITRVQ